jgi:hypothetical protein
MYLKRTNQVMTIRYKTTGQLIDELITTRFKVEINPSEENVTRMNALDEEIKQAITGKEDSIYWQVVKLRVVLRQCWDAQEIVKNESMIIHQESLSIAYLNKLLRLAEAGVMAMTTNRTRNKLVREIDEILGESSATPLTKTY